MYGFACVFFLAVLFFVCCVHIFLFQSNSSLSVGSYQQEPADTIMYIGHAFAFVCTLCVLYMNRWWVRVGEIRRKLSIGPINNGIFSLSTAMGVCVCVFIYNIHACAVCVLVAHIYLSIHSNKWTWCHANSVGVLCMHLMLTWYIIFLSYRFTKDKR